MNKYICEMCNQPHNGLYGSGRFCSARCARCFSTKNKRQLINKKVSDTLKVKKQKEANIRKQEYDKHPRLCPICGHPIPYGSNNKTCSKNCLCSYLSIKQKQTPREYKENGLGYGKSGWYNGIFCNSTYELVYVIYCVDHNINILRNKKGYRYEWKGKTKMYYPDFLVDGDLVEIKGYDSEQVQAKINAVPVPVKLLFYEDLLPYMNYVDTKYGTHHTKKHNNYISLYEK